VYLRTRREIIRDSPLAARTMTEGRFAGLWNATNVNSMFFKRGELIRNHGVWKSVGLKFAATSKIG
jgi:hypothetical protein